MKTRKFFVSAAVMFAVIASIQAAPKWKCMVCNDEDADRYFVCTKNHVMCKNCSEFEYTVLGCNGQCNATDDYGDKCGSACKRVVDNDAKKARATAKKTTDTTAIEAAVKAEIKANHNGKDFGAEVTVNRFFTYNSGAEGAEGTVDIQYKGNTKTSNFKAVKRNGKWKVDGALYFRKN